VYREQISEIVQSFTGAGWDNDDTFTGYLVIGYSGNNLSIVAHKKSWESDNLIFELLDHKRNVTYWVKEAPTPQQAQQLLEEHGELPEK
jgi:hypothetical protein